MNMVPMLEECGRFPRTTVVRYIISYNNCCVIVNNCCVKCHVFIVPGKKNKNKTKNSCL